LFTFLVGRRKKHSCFIDSLLVGLLKETPHSHTARKKTESKREEIIQMEGARVKQEGEKEGQQTTGLSEFRNRMFIDFLLQGKSLVGHPALRQNKTHNAQL
jgi:hypothetical protein